MKALGNLRKWALMAGIGLLTVRAGAQNIGLLAVASTNSIAVSNSLTYTITITNQSGGNLENVSATNSPSSLIQLVSASFSQGSVTNDTNSVTFNLGEMTNGSFATMTLTLLPLTPGMLTNAIVITTTTSTNTVMTNVVVQVTAPLADLGVRMGGFPSVIIVNDQVSYNVAVTNFGPDTVPGFVLTNVLPPGVLLTGVSPPNLPYTTVDNNLVFNFGSLPSGSGTNLQFFIEPTNAATLDFSATVNAGFYDTNSSNDSASMAVTVADYLPSMLEVVTNSAQVINHQDGLTEQSILVSNIGTTDAPAVRIVVASLTNQLFNAVGTNDGNPFVVYAGALPVKSSVSLLLQYLPRSLFPFTNGQLHAYAVPMPDLTPPPVASTSTNINITRILQLSNGDILVEFPSTTGQSYTIVYSDNILFSNALMATPSVTAPGNRVQWIDYGPPETVSAPNSESTRFYRVFLNP